MSRALVLVGSNTTFYHYYCYRYMTYLYTWLISVIHMTGSVSGSEDFMNLIMIDMSPFFFARILYPFCSKFCYRNLLLPSYEIKRLAFQATFSINCFLYKYKNIFNN